MFKTFVVPACLITTILLSACGGGGAGGTMPAGSPSKGGTNGSSSAPQGHTVYFISQQLPQVSEPSIFAYDSSQTGTQNPIFTISNTSAVGIFGVATDALGDIYTMYATSNTGGRTNYEIVEYPPNGAGVVPIRTIAGSNTELTTGIPSLAVAPDGTIAVSEPFGPPNCAEIQHILVFSPASNGNVAPTRDISGTNTRLFNSGTIALGPDGTVYVAGAVTISNGLDNSSILAFGPAANGNALPTATIAGSNTKLGYIPAIALPTATIAGSNTKLGYIPAMTTTSDRVVLLTRQDFNQEAGSILEFPLTASGNVSPTKTITLPIVGSALALDTLGNYYAYVDAKATVDIYAPSASGAASPISSFVPTIPAFNGCGTCNFLGQMAAH